ncbi:hypothetical protein ACEWY4_028118 [Coilia grayii]|uniref:Small integral membrane protein 26 n=1 Tax=Coilia grayii TaxID=363190 RepID=A0ABD1IMR0_9TELE
MRPNDVFKWNKRASMMYAFGAWTIFGSLIYYKYSHKDDPFVASQPGEEVDKPNVKKYETTHNKTTIVYKEDFVPYSTRLINFFTGSKPSAAPKESDELKSD